MRAETLQSEAFDDGRLGLQRGERGIGTAAFGDIADDKLLAEFRVNALRMFCQCCVGGSKFKRRAAALNP